jgi:hypothetical protein
MTDTRAKQLVTDLIYINYATNRDLGATFQQCVHPQAYGEVARQFEERYRKERA